MRRVALIAGGLILALLAAEVLLQLGAWIVWSRRALPEAGSSDSGGVLCIGDSFTYGLGARDRDANSYPSALERELQRPKTEGAQALTVINAGWPGQDSRAVLNQLPGQLDAYRPRVVYALVGYNDFWKSTPDEASAGFPIRFRLGALASLAYHALRGTVEEDSSPTDPPRSPADADFLGPWHLGPAWFEFCADGTFDSSGGPLPFLWSWRERTIVLRERGSGRESEMTYRYDGAALVLEGGPFPTATALARGLPNVDALDRARIAIRDGRHEGVEELLREALDSPRADEARSEWIAWLADRGRQSEAEQAIAPMLDRWQRSPTPVGGRALVSALLVVGLVDEAMEVAGDYLASLPFDEKIAEHVIHEAGTLQDKDGLEASMRAAIARPDITPAERAALYGVYHATDPDDPQRRAAALVATLVADLGSTTAERTLAWEPDKYPREDFVAALDVQTDGEPALRDRVLARYDELRDGADQTRQGLEFGLHAIATACREAGAAIVFLTYPTDRPRVRAAVLAYCEDRRVPVVDVFAEFRSRVPDDDELAALFVLDGHCNDAGYRLMGRIVSEDARVRLAD